jgi:hypothetical protein
VGGVVFPSPPLNPQQATLPSVFTPQLWKPPALTLVKLASGGVVWPVPLYPQQREHSASDDQYQEDQHRHTDGDPDSIFP